MSNSRHVLLLACTHALALSCATRPPLSGSRTAPGTPAMPAWPSQAELRGSEPLNANPYVPIRSPNAAVYSWQNEKRVQCAPGPLEPEPAAGSERALEPRASAGVLAAFPERPSFSGSSAQSAKPVSPELVVARLRPALHQCFSHWLDDRADAHGSANFALELGCAGEVEAISAEVHSVDTSTVSCLFSAIAPVRFAPPIGGHAVVRVPIVFKNSAR